MQTLVAALTLTTAGLLIGCTGVTRQNTDTRPPRLQVSVLVPPSMSILFDEEVAEAFAYRVSSVLHEEGFRGRINIIDGDPPVAGVPILEVHLLEWRVDRMGSVDCTFGATLIGRDGPKSLGIFSGSDLMMWSRRDWFARAQGFEHAAADAIRNLARRLEETGMIDAPVRR